MTWHLQNAWHLQMTWHLQNAGHAVNEKPIRRLMRLMRLMPIYQKPNTSKPAKGHQTCPDLLGGLRIGRPNQVWCADIPYLPMRKGFLYLVAIMDWFTCKVLAWRISNTLEAEVCLDALNAAIHKFGAPEIMNTDQGSQFTSFDWTDRLKRAKTKISMDGKARYLDNPRAFTRTNGVHALDMSRLWRSMKYQCVSLHARETGSPAKAGVGRWIPFYNHLRPHTIRREIGPPDQFLIRLKPGGQPPAVVCHNSIETDQQVQAAA